MIGRGPAGELLPPEQLLDHLHQVWSLLLHPNIADPLTEKVWRSQLDHAARSRGIELTIIHEAGVLVISDVESPIDEPDTGFSRDRRPRPGSRQVDPRHRHPSWKPHLRLVSAQAEPGTQPSGYPER